MQFTGCTGGGKAEGSYRFLCAERNQRKIQYYAITGFVAGSPREVLRESYKANLISDETWMEMLKVRNELAHDYDGEIVKEHCQAIVQTYIDLFYDFEKTVKGLQIQVPLGTEFSGLLLKPETSFLLPCI